MLRKFLAVLLLIPLPVLADHVPTQEPYGYNESVNTETGDLTISLLGSDGFEDSPPEKYTIFFAMATGVDASSYCVSTSFGHEQNVWNDYVFSISDLRTYFELPVGTFYYRVRSDNDTDNSYSTISAERSIALPDQTPFNETQTDWSAPTTTCVDTSTTTTTTTTTTTIPPAVPDDATNISVNYQGKDVYFSWEYTDGNTVAKEFHINYSYDNATWERVIITDTTARTYTLDYTNIQTGTFYWTFGVCGDLENGESCTDSDSNNFETTEYIPPTTTTVYVPPPPPPTTTTTLPPKEVVIMDDGTEAEYTTTEIEDGTVERDNERKANEEKFGCFMTDAQIERGDCDIPEEEPVEKVIIIEDEEQYDTEGELSEDDDMVFDLESEDEVEELEPIKEEDIIEEEFKIDVKELEEEFKFEEEDFVLEIIIEEDIDEEVEEITEEVLDEPIQEDVEEVLEDELDQEVLRDDNIREKEIQEEDVKDQVVQEVKELTEEEIAVEVAEIEEVVKVPIVEEDATEEEVAEAIEEYVEELETEEVIEVLEEVNDVGVQNLEEVSEEIQEVIQAVVEEAIEDVEELTEEQVAVVAEVLQVQEDDVEIIAEAVKEDEAVAEAVEEYVERAVENADVENYTLADVVTEVQYENFLENPIETFVDLDFEGITISNIGEDMTQDQKEKAQEVVVPVILTRIATMAAFVFRRSL